MVVVTLPVVDVSVDKVLVLMLVSVNEMLVSVTVTEVVEMVVVSSSHRSP